MTTIIVLSITSIPHIVTMSFVCVRRKMILLYDGVMITEL